MDKPMTLTSAYITQNAKEEWIGYTIGTWRPYCGCGQDLSMKPGTDTCPRCNRAYTLRYATEVSASAADLIRVKRNEVTP